jgi:hypothetical protein
VSKTIIGISYINNNADMSELLQSVITHLKKEIDKPEWKQKILEPIVKWCFAIIWPYVLGIIFVNFFTTIAAVSLVLYLYHKNLSK